MTTKYQELAGKLRAAIEQQTYEPGGMMPSIRELAATYGYSVETTSRAIQLLSDDGLLEPVQKRGTRIRDRKPVQVLLALSVDGLGPWETACHQAGLDGEMQTVDVSRLPAPPDAAHALGLAEGDPVFCRSRHALLDGRPVQIQRAYYPADRFTDTPLARPEKIVGGVRGALEALGIAMAATTSVVSGRPATDAEAGALRLRPGVMLLELRRTTVDALAQPVEYLQIAADPARTAFVHQDSAL